MGWEALQTFLGRLGDPLGCSGWVGGPSWRSERVNGHSGSLGRVGDPPERSETGRVTPSKVLDGQGTLPEVQDGSWDLPRGLG